MGTSSIKAVLASEKGEILSRARIDSVLLNPQDGFFEVDAQKTWWDGMKDALSTLAQNTSLEKIKAVCVSSMCGTFVPVDSDLKPVHNAILYGIDTRAVKQIEMLNTSYDKKYLFETVGGLFNTHSMIPKIMWLKENKPEVYEKTAHFLESNNYVTSKLTNETAWDYPTAAGTKLLNLKEMSLHNRIISDHDIDIDKFPSFKWPLDILGVVSKEAGEQTGLPAGIPVVTGACDINAEAAACGGIYPGDLVVVFGSTLSTLFTLERPHTLEGFTPGVSILEGTYRLGAATSSGGRFVEWVQGLLNNNELDLSDQSPSGIIILPYIDGARAPYDNPDSKGVIFGLKKNTTDSTLIKASVESLGFELNLLIKKMGQISKLPEKIHVLGGMSQNKDVLRLIADIVGKELIVYKDIDAAYGDCLLAMTSGMKYEDIKRLDFVRKYTNAAIRIRPDLNKTQAYKTDSEKFMILYERIKDLF